MNIKTILFILCFQLAASSCIFAENLVLENQTSYPQMNKKSIISVQWAASAKEVDEGNKALIYGFKLKPESLKRLSQSGNKLDIPKKAEYFRVLVWTAGEESPDLVTNWVDVIPDKTYVLKQDHLVPAVLMSGTGC